MYTEIAATMLKRFLDNNRSDVSLRRGLRDAATTQSDEHEAETRSEQQQAGRFGDNEGHVRSHDAPEFEGR